jgi:hypothetical protein
VWEFGSTRSAQNLQLGNIEHESRAISLLFSVYSAFLPPGARHGPWEVLGRRVCARMMSINDGAAAV